MRVAKVINSKLQQGDTFSCRVIAQGQALIVDNLKSGGQDQTISHAEINQFDVV